MPIWKIHHLARCQNSVLELWLKWRCLCNSTWRFWNEEKREACVQTQQSTVRFMTGSWSLECKTRLCSQGDGVHEVHERIGNMSKEREGGACNRGQIFRWFVCNRDFTNCYKTIQRWYVQKIWDVEPWKTNILLQYRSSTRSWWDTNKSRWICSRNTHQNQDGYATWLTS